MMTRIICLLLLGTVLLLSTDAFSTVTLRGARRKTSSLNYRNNLTDAEVLSPLKVDFAKQSPLRALIRQRSPAIAKKEEPMDDVTKARFLLLAAAALYGSNFSLIKIFGETGMSVGLTTTLRFGMAALATMPWILALHDESAHKSRRFQQLLDPKGVEFQAALGGLEVGMWNSIGYVSQAVGLQTTSASKSAFLCSLAVVIVPLLDYIAGKTLLSKQVVGTLLAVIGVGLLELDGTSISSLSGDDVASLIQPFAFGLGFWRMEATMRRHPEEAARTTAGQLLAVFLGSGAYLMATSLMDPSTVPSTDQFVSWVTDPTILAALFWTGVVTTAMTIYMETAALKTLSAAETTLIFSTEPLFGAGFAMSIMGETLGLNAAAGAALILFGCVFSNLGLDGILSSLPWSKNQIMDSFSKKDMGRFELLGKAPIDLVRKFSLRATMAGVFTGIVLQLEGASGSETDGLKEFLKNLHISGL